MASQIEINATQVPEHNEITVIKLVGEIDESNLEELKQVADPLVQDDSTQKIVLNLKDLAFINSKVIGYLAAYYTALSQVNKKMAFAEANTGIMEILSLVGLTNLVSYYDSEEEAVNSFIIE